MKVLFERKKVVKKIMMVGLIGVMMLFMAACVAEKTEDEKIAEVIKPEMMKVVIGRGYDITGRYAYSPEIKDAIMDYDKLSLENKIIHDNNLEKSEFETYSGNTITSYQNELAVSASVSAGGGVEGVASFEGEVGANFKRERYESDEYAFATSTSKITKGAYYIEGKSEPSKLEAYLSEAFKTDLKAFGEGKKTGSDFIKKYGTHVMLGGIWGARLDYHFSTKKKVKNASTQIGAYAKAKAEVTFGIGSGSGGTQISTDSAFSEYFETTSVAVSTVAYGGSSEYARDVHDNGSYKAWIETIAQNPVWSDYYPESLIPIYELTTDEKIKENLKTEYNKYLEGKVIKITNKESVSNVEYPFIAQNFTDKVKGDGDINSKSGRNTDYEFTIKISKNGTNLLAEIDLRVAEVASDYTTYEKKGYQLTIPVNKNITSLDLGVSSFTKTGRISGERHDWILLDTTGCEFLPKGLYIMIDGDGDDKDKVGLKGTFNIPIHYRPITE